MRVRDARKLLRGDYDADNPDEFHPSDALFNPNGDPIVDALTNPPYTEPEEDLTDLDIISGIFLPDPNPNKAGTPEHPDTPNERFWGGNDELPYQDDNPFLDNDDDDIDEPDDDDDDLDDNDDDDDTDSNAMGISECRDCPEGECPYDDADEYIR